MINPLGPNISNEDDNFFQSDTNIELSRNRKLKKANYSDAGNPMDLGSKILHFLIAGSEAYVATSAYTVQKLDLSNSSVVQVFKGHKGPVTHVQIDDGFLYSSSWDKTIKKWDSNTGELLITFSGHSDFVKSIKIRDGRLYSASTDKLIGIWDLNGKLIKTLKGHRRSVEDLIVSSCGKFLFSASSDNTIQKWDLETGSSLVTYNGHQTSIYGLFYQPEQDLLLSVSADKTARRLDLQFDLVLKHPDYVKSTCVLSNGFIATGCRDENIRIWDPATEKCVKLIKGHYGEIEHLEAIGNLLYSGSLDSTFRCWNFSDPNVGEQEDVQEKLMTEEEERELEELL